MFKSYPNYIFWRVDFIYNITNSYGASSLVFKMNNVPTGGNCNIAPLSGYAAITEFSITCSSWRDSDGSISSYQFLSMHCFLNLQLTKKKFVLFNPFDI
jgi:hypothetical protein